MRHLLLPLAFLPLPALAQDQQEADRGFLTGFIEDSLSATARTVTIEGFEGALSSRATVARLTIADGAGVWLDARDLVLDWDRSALLGGRIDITELAAGSISVLRAPVPDPAAPSPEATPFALPELPVSVRIDSLRSDRIVLGAPLLGEELALTLAGAVDLAGGEGTATLDARIVEGSEGSLAFAGSYSNATRVLSVDLDLREAEGGLAARALDIPGLPSVALTVQGTAPIDDYAAQLSLATAGEPRVQGEFALQTTAGPEAGAVVERAFGLDLRGDVRPLVSADVGAFVGPDAVLRTKGIRRSDGSLVLTSLRLGAGALDLGGSASINPEGWPERLELSGTLGDGGQPVPLPGVAGTTVEGATLSLAYDQAGGEAWTARLDATGLEREGLRAPEVTLGGGGTIRPATEAAPGLFTGVLDYAARDLAIDDPGLRDALGTAIAGTVDLATADGALDIRRLTLSGPGVEATAEGQVRTGEGLAVESTLDLAAADLGRFAALSGLDELGGAATLRVASTVRPLDGAFDLDLSGETTDLRFGIPELDALLGGAGTVRLVAARDERGTRVSELRVAAAAVTLAGDADLTSAESRARVDLDVTDLGLASPDLSGPGRVTAQGTRDSVGTLVLDADAALPGLALDVRASRAAATGDAPGPVTFAVTGDAEALDRYAALLARLGAPVSPGGSARFDASGTAAADGSTFDLAVSADTTDLRLGLPRVDPLLAGAGTLRGRVARTGPLDLSVDSFRVRTDLLAGQADVTVTDGAARGTLDLALSEVADVLPGLSGPARIAGTAASGADGTVALDLAAEVPGGTARANGALAADARAFAGTVALDLPDIAPFSGLAGRALAGGVEATLDGTVAADLSALDVTVDARADGLRLGVPALDPLLGAATVSGTARGVEGGVDLDLGLGLAGGTARLDGVLDPAARAFSGRAAADVPDLAPFSGLAGRPLGGAVAATFDGTARADLSAFSVSVTGTTRDLRLGIPQADALLRGAGTIQGEAERADGSLALSLTAATPALRAEGAGTFTTGGTGTGGQGRFDVALADVSPLLPGLSGPATAAGTASQGPDGRVALDATATGPGARAAVQATLDPARGFEATGSATVSVADLAPYGALAGTPLRGSLDARVEGTALPSLVRFDLGIDATATDLDAGSPALAQLLAGTGRVSARVARDGAGLRVDRLEAAFPNLSATASGSPTGPIAFDARLADAALFVPDLPGPATARGTARLSPLGLALDAAVTGPGGIEATVAGRLGAAPDLAIRGRAPLALVNGFPEPRRLDGTAAFDLRLAGALSPEALTGTVRVDGARLTDPALGTALTGISGTATLGGGQARVDLSGSLLDGGRLSVSGPVGLAPPFAADLAVAGDGLVIRDPALYEATASGRLTVTGPLAGGATIAGTVDVSGAEVRVPASGVGPLGDLPNVFHIEPSVPVRQTLARAGLGADGAAAGATAGAASASAYALDLLIRAPARVFVRGRGLDSELGGELRLTGTTANVIPAGALRLLRGRLDLLGQRFTLTEGEATLLGDFEPYLRLVAETTARTGTVVRVILEGPAAEPDVRFESTPDLPQDEVLSQLIFGRSIATLTPFQAVQLAAGISTLAGGGGGLLDDLRSGAGLADLDVTVDEGGNAALRLGRYLGENVYTDVTVGTVTSEASINLDLTPDLTVRAGVTSEGETSVGIEFGRDF